MIIFYILIFFIRGGSMRIATKLPNVAYILNCLIRLCSNMLIFGFNIGYFSQKSRENYKLSISIYAALRKCIFISYDHNHSSKNPII